MIAGFFVVPLLAAVVCFFSESRLTRFAALLAAAAFHTALTVTAWISIDLFQQYSWARLDYLGLIFLSIADILFLSGSIYAVGYLLDETAGPQWDRSEKFFFQDIPEQVFCGCLLLFFAAMSLAVTSHHFGLLWVALETTTLVSAPLVCFHRHHRSLEAMWKYLLVCSVGIALGLIGTFFLAAATVSAGLGSPPLILGSLLAAAPSMANETSMFWLKLSYIFVLAGYGTKMGLAPFHSWLPDAHSEAPSVVSVLLSGALLNCAFLGILRVWQVLNAAGAGVFGQHLLLTFGLLSIAVAALFIIRQADFKRMLAYSSIEHMGLLALAAGLGARAAIFAGLLHAVSHSLIKGSLFMTAGNIQRRFHTKLINQVRGLSAVMPFSSGLWVLGFLAITGLPPFGLFVSKFLLLQAALQSGQRMVLVTVLALLTLIFFAMSALVIKMVYGRASGKISAAPERRLLTLPPLVLLAGALILGLFIPSWLNEGLLAAANELGAK
jgi:hydrogenase-4 component F